MKGKYKGEIKGRLSILFNLHILKHSATLNTPAYIYQVRNDNTTYHLYVQLNSLF